MRCWAHAVGRPRKSGRVRRRVTHDTTRRTLVGDPTHATIQLVGNPTTGGQDIAVNQAAFVTPSGNNDLSGSNKVNLGGQHLSITVQNDATTGTVQNRFAMLGGNGRATVATTTATPNP